MKNYTRHILPLTAIMFMISCKEKVTRTDDGRNALIKNEITMDKESGGFPAYPSEKLVDASDDQIEIDGQSDQRNSKYNNQATSTLSNDPIQIKNLKLVKKGEITIKTSNLNDLKKQMDKLLVKFGAYYEREELSSTERMVSFQTIVRVPPAQFENLIAAIESGENEIIRKNITVMNAIREYIDVSSRLTSKRAYLSRYLDLLKTSKNIDEILRMEEVIRALQEEIDLAERRLKTIDDEADLGTLELVMFVEKQNVDTIEVEDTFVVKLKNAWLKGWEAVLGFIVSVINIWPLLMIILAVSIFIRRKYFSKVSNVAKNKI